MFPRLGWVSGCKYLRGRYCTLPIQKSDAQVKLGERQAHLESDSPVSPHWSESNEVAYTKVRLIEDHLLHYFKTTDVLLRYIGLASKQFRKVLWVVRQVCHIRDWNKWGGWRILVVLEKIYLRKSTSGNCKEMKVTSAWHRDETGIMEWASEGKKAGTWGLQVR